MTDASDWAHFSDRQRAPRSGLGESPMTDEIMNLGTLLQKIAPTPDHGAAA